MAVVKRYDISAYCERCGSAEGVGAVEVFSEEDRNGAWVAYADHKAEVDALTKIIDKYKKVLDKSTKYW